MKTEVATWVATAVGSPLIIVILSWTLVIYHYHRRHWQPADLLVAAVIVQGIVKQVATFCYAMLTLLQPFGCEQPLCSAVSWLLNSVHFLQAATLVTFTASRMLAVRYPVRYKQVVKRTHLTYHLFSLAVLATCIGVASVLAETKPMDSILQNENTTLVHSEQKKTRVYCVFLPHELDQRYAVLSIAMHSFLNLASVLMLVATGFGWCLLKKEKNRPHNGARRHGQLLKSDASVMSDSSMGSAKQDGGLLADESHYHQDEKIMGPTRVHKIRKLNAEGLSIMNRNGFDSGKHSATFVRNSSQNIRTSRYQNSSPNDQVLGGASVFNYKYSFSGQNAHNITPTTQSIFKIPSISNCSGNTISKSLMNGSNFEEMYGNIYTRHSNDIAEHTSRWATESSCISSSTSSTNSRAPCLARHQIKTKNNSTVQWDELRLSTAVAVLGLCYIFNHVPALILSVVGTFVSQLLPPNWPLHLVFFWTGMAEECLLPVILALFDDNFSGWIHATYTSDRTLLVDLARHHQGLDGRFRIFNPPLADIEHHNPQQQVKFPITNGSLFTTVCGRHPVIHNYRRGKGTRLPVTVPNQCAGSGVGTQEQYLLQNTPDIKQHPAAAGSHTSFADESRKLLSEYRGFQLFQSLPGSNDGNDEKNTPNMTLSELQMKHSSLGCEEDLNSELTSFGDVNEPIYATLSSRSCCSATTAANDDFEFYQHEANSATCCKSNELYFNDGIVSDILERDNKCNEDPSNCSLMDGKTYVAEFDDLDKLMPQYLYDGLLHVCGKTSSHEDLVTPAVKESNITKIDKSTTDESLLSAIENEIKNRRQEIKLNTSPIPETSEQYKTHYQLDLQQVTTGGCDSPVTDAPVMNNCSYCELKKDKNEQTDVLRERGSTCGTLSPYSHKRYISKGFLKSLSVDNFDELNEELNFHKDTDVADWENKWCSEYQRQFSVYDFNAADRKEIIFELPGKSTSTVNLNGIHLQEDRLPTKLLSPNNACRELHQQLPNLYHAFNKEATVTQNFKQQKGSPQRISKKRLIPVLSMESLLHAVNHAGFSYLDNGELCQHRPNFRASTPDLKTVFVSDYL